MFLLTFLCGNIVISLPRSAIVTVVDIINELFNCHVFCCCNCFTYVSPSLFQSANTLIPGASNRLDE